MRRMRLHFYRSVVGIAGESPTDHAGPTEWRWRIRAGNGKIIADSSEGYQRLGKAVHAAHLVTGLGLVEIAAGQRYDLGTWRVVVDA